ncbi:MULTISPECIES: hypothetical protein [Enterobacter]|uniref:WapI family immunity protein n=1 Tax=unclassified Enterobacter TaxID=2608935 RepID=UPI001E482EC9|nr:MULTISPECIES: hypothetical protein [Enterobacter]WGG68265.1 hypothetical protein QCL67_09290 [Enterobacter ludwigii]
MIDITSGDRHLKLTPYERLTEDEVPAYSRIMVWVEFSIPVLKTEFAAEFFVCQLEQFRNDKHALHQALKTGGKSKDISLTSAFEQVMLKFHQAHFAGAVGVSMVLKPENHADSITLDDSFDIDESYLPGMLSGLDDIISWQN